MPGVCLGLLVPPWGQAYTSEAPTSALAHTRPRRGHPRQQAYIASGALANLLTLSFGDIFGGNSLNYLQGPVASPSRQQLWSADPSTASRRHFRGS